MASLDAARRRQGCASCRQDWLGGLLADAAASRVLCLPEVSGLLLLLLKHQRLPVHGRSRFRAIQTIAGAAPEAVASADRRPQNQRVRVRMCQTGRRPTVHRHRGSLPDLSSGQDTKILPDEQQLGPREGCALVADALTVKTEHGTRRIVVRHDVVISVSCSKRLLANQKRANQWKKTKGVQKCIHSLCVWRLGRIKRHSQ